jgi:hypothetical protein
MNHPKGAIKSTEEMEALIGGYVYLTVDVHAAKKIPRVAKDIIKLHPVKIKHIPHNGYYDTYLEVKEYVDAAEDYGIAVLEDWSVRWGGPSLKYFFANFWHAYAHTLHHTEEADAC